jgi:hypothetical protein
MFKLVQTQQSEQLNKQPHINYDNKNSRSTKYYSLTTTSLVNEGSLGTQQVGLAVSTILRAQLGLGDDLELDEGPDDRRTSDNEHNAVGSFLGDSHV